MTGEIESSEAIGMKQMLEAGVHFGHQKSDWNPRMKSYIFGARNGIHIIDLQQTLSLFEIASNFVKDVVGNGEDVLFVGTKKQAQGIIAEEAIRCEMPYIHTRWLGGTLTNFNTIRSRVNYLLELKSWKKRDTWNCCLKKKPKVSKKKFKSWST